MACREIDRNEICRKSCILTSKLSIETINNWFWFRFFYINPRSDSSRNWIRGRHGKSKLHWFIFAFVSRKSSDSSENKLFNGQNRTSAAASASCLRLRRRYGKRCLCERKIDSLPTVTLSSITQAVNSPQNWNNLNFLLRWPGVLILFSFARNKYIKTHKLP